MPETNYQLLSPDTYLAALRVTLQQATQGLIDHHKASGKSRGNISSELQKVFEEVTTQVAFDNSQGEFMNSGEAKGMQRGCISDAANLLGVSRCAFRTRKNNHNITLTPCDEDIPH